MRWCVAGDVSNAVKCFERKATQFGGATAKRVKKSAHYRNPMSAISTNIYE